MVIYSMEANAVEPVFYPVVPDSFMNRGSGPRTGRHASDHGRVWNVETDVPLLAPQDRWCF